MLRSRIDELGASVSNMRKEITKLSRPTLSQDIRDRLLRPTSRNGKDSKILSHTTQNPSVKKGQYTSSPVQTNGNGNGAKKSSPRRYYAMVDDETEWPPELNDYNKRFGQTLGGIKRRHDSVVTTIGMFRSLNPVSWSYSWSPDNYL